MRALGSIERTDVIAAADAVGCSVDADAADCLARHLELVRGPGMRIRVVADASAQQLLFRHMADSLVAVSIIDDLVASTPPVVLDIGSGGGFPGLVIAMVRRSWEVVLAESQSKRAGFLLQAVHTLGIPNARVIAGRAEDYAPCASIITGRAVTSLATFASIAEPLLLPGGALVLHRGPDVDRELHEAERYLRTSPLDLHARHAYRIPGDEVGREIVVFTRRSE